MNDIFFIACCAVYVVCEAMLALLGYRRLHWSSETVRKFIHILTANLIIPVIYWIEAPGAKLFGPALFIVINAIATYSGLGKLLGMSDSKRHVGLIYYPTSVLFLTFLHIQGWMSASSVVAGVFIMGWGDGLAGMIGSRFGKHKYTVFGKYHKSLEGSLAMAFAAFVVVLLASDASLWIALALAVVSTVIENISPSSLDNISVPILSAFLLEVLCTL